MKKRILIIVAVMLAIAGVLFLVLRSQGEEINTADTIHAASAGSGNIAEKIIGDPDKAKVVLYEYADYGCSHCAEWNRRLNKLLEEYGEDLALVFRAYDIGFNNGSLASLAATAAQLQGYFKEYKDLLFSNQSEWMYAEGAAVQDLFVEYFEEASKEEGDTGKFKYDMTSEAVSKRVNFEQRMGERVKLKGTPMFRIDGETIEAGELLDTIEAMIRG